MEEVERRRDEGGIWFEKVISKDRQEQRVERWQRIVESRYNRWFKVIKEGGISEYLKKNWGESRWRRVIRFRLGNEMKTSAYWEEEERKMCRVCEEEIETWEHVWENCREWRRELVGGNGEYSRKGGRRGRDEEDGKRKGEEGGKIREGRRRGKEGGRG